MSVQEIREEALKLPPEDREHLAQELWASVDEEPEDEELKAVLDRRWDEMVSGKVETLSLAEVMQETRKRIEGVRKPARILETENFR